MSFKRQIDKPRVFHLQKRGHITTENDFSASCVNNILIHVTIII